MEKIKVPFSNGTEYMAWHEQNCAKCKHYEYLSTKRSQAGCILSFDIDMSQIDGMIDKDTFESIGMDGLFFAECWKKHLDIRTVKVDVSAMKQQTIL